MAPPSPKVSTSSGCLPSPRSLPLIPVENSLRSPTCDGLSNREGFGPDVPTGEGTERQARQASVAERPMTYLDNAATSVPKPECSRQVGAIIKGTSDVDKAR